MRECEEVFKLYEKLIKSNENFFPKKGVKINISEQQGVYIIYSPENVVLHVGTTKTAEKGLNQRLQNHLTGTSSFRRKYIKPNNIDLRTGYKFKFINVEDDRKRAFLEALTIGLQCPAHIGTGVKK